MCTLNMHVKRKICWLMKNQGMQYINSSLTCINLAMFAKYFLLQVNVPVIFHLWLIKNENPIVFLNVIYNTWTVVFFTGEKNLKKSYKTKNSNQRVQFHTLLCCFGKPKRRTVLDHKPAHEPWSSAANGKVEHTPTLTPSAEPKSAERVSLKHHHYTNSVKCIIFVHEICCCWLSVINVINIHFVLVGNSTEVPNTFKIGVPNLCLTLFTSGVFIHHHVPSVNQEKMVV